MDVLIIAKYIPEYKTKPYSKDFHKLIGTFYCLQYGQSNLYTPHANSQIKK